MRSPKQTNLKTLAPLGIFLLFSACVKPVPTDYEKWSPCDTQNTDDQVDVSCAALCTTFFEQCEASSASVNNGESSSQICDEIDNQFNTQRSQIAQRACELGCQAQLEQTDRSESEYKPLCDFAKRESSNFDIRQCAGITSAFNNFCADAAREIQDLPMNDAGTGGTTDAGGEAGSGGGSGMGGMSGAGGQAGAGGTAGMGGTAGSGGEAGAGGTAGAGGEAGTGGGAGTAGAAGMGGTAGTGGMSGAGGEAGTGGMSGAGGTAGMGGGAGTGGEAGAGGEAGMGAMSGAGGEAGMGGGAGTGGEAGAGGEAGMTGNDPCPDEGPLSCAQAFNCYTACADDIMLELRDDATEALRPCFQALDNRFVGGYDAQIPFIDEQNLIQSCENDNCVTPWLGELEDWETELDPNSGLKACITHALMNELAPSVHCIEYKDTCIWCFGLDQSEDGLSEGFDAGEVGAMCVTNDVDLPPKVTTSGDFAGLLNEQDEDPRWACNTSINTAIRSYLWQKECLNPKATIEVYFNADTDNPDTENPDTDRVKEAALSDLCEHCRSQRDCPLVQMIRETGPFDRVGQRPISSENARARLVTACLSSDRDSCEDHRKRLNLCKTATFWDSAVTDSEKQACLKTVGQDFLVSEQNTVSTVTLEEVDDGRPGATCNSSITGGDDPNARIINLDAAFNNMNDCFDLCVDYKTVEGRPFIMGTEDEIQNAAAPSCVNPPSFEMGKTEITVRQYDVCIKRGNCTAPTCVIEAGLADPDAQTWSDPIAPENKNKPVNCVTWTQAQIFAQFIGARLPTDAEWEFAARDGGLENMDYPGTFDPQGDVCLQANVGILNEETPELVFCQESPTNVCAFASGAGRDYIASPGLCDMAGNVWEWVEDHYRSANQTSNANGTPADPPDDTDIGIRKLRRGGSWQTGPLAAHTRRRGNENNNDAFANGGFRLARTLDTTAAVPDATSFCDRPLDSTCDGDIQCNSDACVDGTCVVCDADEDGFDAPVCGGADCNDTRDSINPGADEICGDGLDNDCDTVTDEDCPVTVTVTVTNCYEAYYAYAACYSDTGSCAITFDGDGLQDWIGAVDTCMGNAVSDPSTACDRFLKTCSYCVAMDTTNGFIPGFGEVGSYAWCGENIQPGGTLNSTATPAAYPCTVSNELELSWDNHCTNACVESSHCNENQCCLANQCTNTSECSNNGGEGGQTGAAGSAGEGGASGEGGMSGEGGGNGETMCNGEGSLPPTCQCDGHEQCLSGCCIDGMCATNGTACESQLSPCDTNNGGCHSTAICEEPDQPGPALCKCPNGWSPEGYVAHGQVCREEGGN